MSRIVWDAPGERRYEIGVDRGVFYSQVGGIYTNGVAWNGLTGVDDENGGRDATPLYSGDVKVGSEYTPEEYSGSIHCYTYPDEFEEYLGEAEVIPGVYARQQERGLFGFCYRSLVGNDTEGTDHGYKLHLIYNMRVTDFSRSYATINDSNEVQETQISFESFPQEVSDEELDPMCEFVIDSRNVEPVILEGIEDILYGEEGAPRLPYPDEILTELAHRRRYISTPTVYTRILSSGGHFSGSSSTDIPAANVTVRSISISGVPEKYSNSLEPEGWTNVNALTGNLDLYYGFTNVSSGTVRITENFQITVTLDYVENDS